MLCKQRAQGGAIDRFRGWGEDFNRVETKSRSGFARGGEVVPENERAAASLRNE